MMKKIGKPNLPKEVIEELREWHEANGYICCARSEGQWCCIDYLVNDEAWDYILKDCK